MNQAQFDAAKTAERKRLNILHSEQVTSSRTERLPCESYLLVHRTQLQQALVSASYPLSDPCYLTHKRRE
jgi:hypothetical protein